MAESKRHMDVPKERVLERPAAPTHAPKPTKKGTSNRALSGLLRQAMTANQISPSAAICM